MTTIPEHEPISTLGRILHAAMALGPQMWNGAFDSPQNPVPDPTNLSRNLLELFSLLNSRRANYLLVGGVALLRYVSGRNTDDIDLIIDDESLKRMPELVIEDKNPDAARARFGNVRVDLLFTHNPVFRLVSEKHHAEHRFAEVGVRCATIEGLLLLKLYALPRLYQQGDLQRAALFETDITMLAQRAQPDLNALLKVLEPHLAAGEQQELARVIAEIQQRLMRMRGTR